MTNSAYRMGFVFVLGIFLMAGCGSNPPDTGEIIRIASSQEKRIGSIQSLGGAYTSTGATHLLKMEDGTNLHLKSQKVTLDNEKYREKQIEVMGEITRTRDGNQIMEVMSVDVLEQENTSLEEAPLWTEYSSEKMGLSFKYRDDYLLRENDSIIVERRPDDSITTATLYDATAEGSTTSRPSQMIMELVSPNPEMLPQLMSVKSMEPSDILAEGFTRSKITQKGLEAYKGTPSSDETVYWMANETGVYKFQYRLAGGEANRVEFQNMFFDILASMEFSGSQTTNIGEGSLNSEDMDVNLNADTEKKQIEAADETDEGDEAVESNEDAPIQTTTFEEISGFTTFQSESAGFSVQYPKSYYFGPNEKKSADTIRSYQFGRAPLEETPGDIILEMVSSNVPDGQKLSFNGMSMTAISEDGNSTFYAEIGGKTYRISGPQNRSTIMKQMLSTVF